MSLGAGVEVIYLFNLAEFRPSGLFFHSARENTREENIYIRGLKVLQVIYERIDCDLAQGFFISKKKVIFYINKSWAPRQLM